MSKKRVKIWFDDDGEPHETVIEEGEDPPPAPAAASNTHPPADTAGLHRPRVWFDDEGEPHEEPENHAAPPPADPRPGRVWFDDEGLPHATQQAADAANAAYAQTDAEPTRVTSTPGPQTHSSFTQGLTPKPMYFERVETARENVVSPRVAQAPLRAATPTTATPTDARAATPAAATATDSRAATPTTPRTPSVQAPVRAATPVGQRVAAAPGAARPGAVQTQPPVAQPAAARQASAVGISKSGPAGDAPAHDTPTRVIGTAHDTPTRVTGTVHDRPARVAAAVHDTPTRVTGAPQARRDMLITEDTPVTMAPERTVVTRPSAPLASEAPAAPAERQATSSSLATNYRAAVTRAAMMDSANRAAAPQRHPGPQSAPFAPGSSSSDTGFEDFNERTVATASPFAGTLASSTPAPRATGGGQHTPVVSRPTLTHTPVPMDDRTHAPRERQGGFFHRGADKHAAVSSGGFFGRAAEFEAAPSLASFFERPPSTVAPTAPRRPIGRTQVPPPGPDASSRGVPEKSTPQKAASPKSAAQKDAPEGFFARPASVEPTFRSGEPMQAPSRRTTDPLGAPAPIPQPNARANRPAAPPPAKLPGDGVHEQATVVRDSPFLHSEPTVVRSPEQEAVEPAPMRRRLTEPMFARATPAVTASSPDKGIATCRAPLWRLSVAGCIDALAAAAVGLCSAAAEMLTFGGHWPAEATNAMDALALWMHNYPGTQKRAVLIMLLFAWGYAALGARTGRTPGRMLMRLIAIQDDGTMMTWSRAALRSCAALVSALLFGAGYFWAIVDARHRAAHDILSRSVVVLRRSS